MAPSPSSRAVGGDVFRNVILSLILAGFGLALATGQLVVKPNVPAGIGFMVVGLGLAAFSIWWWRRSHARAAAEEAKAAAREKASERRAAKRR